MITLGPLVATLILRVPVCAEVHVLIGRTFLLTVVAETKLTVLMSAPFQYTLTLPQVRQVVATSASRVATTLVRVSAAPDLVDRR